MIDAITLTNAERIELTRRANSRTDRAEDARRARLILLLADGHTWDEASERIECSRGFVASWSKRFAEQRIAGLYERDVIARGVFTSVPDLKRKLMRYIRHDNKSPRTVKWKYADPSRHIGTQSVGTGH